MNKIGTLTAAACAVALSIGVSAPVAAATDNPDFERELAWVQSLEAAEANRATIVNDIVDAVRNEAQSKFSGGWEPELRNLLNGIAASRLISAQAATASGSSYSAVVSAATNYEPTQSQLTGFSDFAAYQEGGVGIPAAIDDSTGLSFRAITPCRIVDTRNVSAPLIGDVARSFHVDNSAVSGIIAAQGGDCTEVAPAEMAGIAVNITVVRPTGSGFVTLYPEGDARPNASVTNFISGQVTANSTVVKTPIASGADFQLYALNTVNVVVDLLGYFVPQDTVRTAASVNTSNTFGFDTPECPAGYQYIGAEFSWGPSNTNVWMTGVARALPPSVSAPDLESARCRGSVAGGTGTQAIICYAVCQR